MKAIVIAAVLLALGGAFGNYLRYTEETPHRPADYSVIPNNTERYSGVERRFSETSYEVLRADTTTLRRYVGPDGEVYWLFVAYFESQKYGSQIHSPKHCLPGGGWQILQHEDYALPLPDGSTKNINRLVIADRGNQQLMLYWFETRGGDIRNEFGLKFDLVMNSLLFRPTDAAIVRLTLPLRREDTIASATKRAETFLQTFYPAIAQALPFDS